MKSAEIMRLMGDIDLLDPDPDKLRTILMREQATLNSSHRSELLVEIAFDLAYWGHEDAPHRASGEAYIFHLVRSGIKWIWCQRELDIRDDRVTQGVIVHDTTEDAKKAGLPPELVHTNITALLGVGVASDVYYNTKQKHEGENGNRFFRRLLTTEDWHPIVIRLIERSDNIETLESMPIDKQLRKIKETKRWREPLVERLNHLLKKQVKEGVLEPKWLRLPGYLDTYLINAIKTEEARLRKVNHKL